MTNFFHTLHNYAVLSKQAYLSKPFLYNSRISNIISDNESGVACHLIHDNDSLIITFRGTEKEDLADIKTNLNFKKIPLPTQSFNKTVFFYKNYIHSRVHNGFLSAFLSVFSAITNTIITLNPKKLIFCGHSLGGAIALIAAVYYRTNPVFLIPISCFTYGQPRVGNWEFKQLVYSLHNPDYFNYCRVVHNCDIVTRIPKLNYFHTGKIIYFDRKGRLHFNLPWFSVFDFILSTHKARFISDHSIDNYIFSLLNYV